MVVLCQMNGVQRAVNILEASFYSKPYSMKEVDQVGIEKNSDLNTYIAAGYRYNISRAYGSSTTRSQMLKKSVMLTHTGEYYFFYF